MATRKVQSLLEAGATVRVISPVLSEPLELLATAGRIGIERRAYQDGDARGAFLVIAATDDRVTNAAVGTEARRERALVMLCDDPEASDATGVAIIRRGGVTVTVATDGASPAVARLLREELEAFLTPARLALLKLVADERERLQRNGRHVDVQRWQQAVSPALLAVVAAGDEHAARRQLRTQLGLTDVEAEAGCDETVRRDGLPETGCAPRDEVASGRSG